MVRQALQLVGSLPAVQTPETETGGVATRRQLESYMVDSVGPQEYIREQPKLGALPEINSRAADQEPCVASGGQSALAGPAISTLAAAVIIAKPITIIILIVICFASHAWSIFIRCEYLLCQRLHGRCDLGHSPLCSLDDKAPKPKQKERQEGQKAEPKAAAVPTISPKHSQLLDAMRADPNGSLATWAAALGKGRSGIGELLGKMAKLGLVEKAESGRWTIA
jgi:hypothetical protein